MANDFFSVPGGSLASDMANDGFFFHAASNNSPKPNCEASMASLPVIFSPLRIFLMKLAFCDVMGVLQQSILTLFAVGGMFVSRLVNVLPRKTRGLALRGHGASARPGLGGTGGYMNNWDTWLASYALPKKGLSQAPTRLYETGCMRNGCLTYSSDR